MSDTDRNIGPRWPDVKPPRRPLARAYAKIALGLVGRAFVIAQRVDPDVRRELAGLAPGCSFALRVHPAGPSAALVIGPDGLIRYVGAGPERPEVLVLFKNMRAAMQVLTFSASAFVVYATGGLVISGDIGSAMAIIRALGIVETILLPAFIARKVLKRLFPMPRGRKAGERARLYLALPFAGRSKE
jgi:hypothetical protein